MCSVLFYFGTFFNFNLVVRILEDLQRSQGFSHCFSSCYSLNLKTHSS